MGYRGRIKTVYTSLQRHAYTDRLPETELTGSLREFPFYIGKFEDIVGDLELWEPRYLSNDTEKLHPIYQKHPVNAPYIYMNKSLSSAVLDLKKNKLTPFLYVDDTVYNSVKDVNEVIGYGFTNKFNHTNNNTEQTDSQDMPVGERFNITGSKNRITKYGIDTFGKSIWRMKDIYDLIFENGEVSGVKGVYNEENDSVIVPSFGEKDKNDSYIYNFYDDNDNIKLFIENNEYYYDYAANLMGYTGGNTYYKIGGYFVIKTPDNVDINCYLPIPLSFDTTNPNFVVRVSSQLREYDTKTIPFLLKDENGKYWIMYITNLPAYGEYNYPRNIEQGRFNIYLIKIEDMPNSVSVTWTLSQHFSDISELYSLLDEIFKPVEDKEGEDYGDEGKDITGEGDIYDGIDNSDEVVGGDHDLTDIIDTDAANPNYNYGSFAASTGFFGSYKVSTHNLIRYTETVKKLKETGAGIPVIGTAYSEVANDMTTGVTETLMLPIDIADNIGGKQMLIQSPLAMGNVGVWDGTGSFSEYILGNHIEQSKLVMNNIYEWTVNLGTIKHYYDNFLDFAPYSTASLYIPYIGTVELPINLIQSNKKETKNLKLSFRLDITSGNIVCIFFVNDVAICHWNGNCARNLKIAVNDNAAAMRGTINSIMAMASAAAGFNTSRVATAGSSNAYGASLNSYSGTSSGKSQTSGMSQSLNMNRGRTSTQANGGDINRSETSSGGKNWGSSASNSSFSSMNSGSTSSESLSSSTTITDNNTNGATSQFTLSPPRPVEAPISAAQTLIGNGQDARGDMGWLDSQMIYLTIERPQWWRPNDYGDLIGYPTKKIAKLSSIQGFATVPYIHLRCRATAEEKARLQSILSQGVKF